MKSKLLFILSLLGSIICQGQLIVRGGVVDSLQKPLPFANVYAYEPGNKTIIAFTTTDNSGRFELEISSEKTITVEASLLGYAPEQKTFEAGAPVPAFVQFVLSPRSIELKEAVVTASGVRVIERSDTITFRADAYRDSTERNLEELLAKLPGVSVDEKSGIISVRGQPIKKILVEGDDLTGRNYQLISKNINADIIDKIQIIDRFEENRLLRGLRNSEDKVINITLKEKELLFGNAIVGFGNDNRTKNSLNLFNFYDKIKIFTFGSFNTTGQESDADRLSDSDQNEETEAQRQRALLKPDDSSFIQIDRAPNVDLGSQNIRFNRAAMLSSLFSTHPRQNLSLKGGITFANDRQRLFVNNDWRFRLPDSNFVLIERNEWTRRPEVWQGRLEALWDISTFSSLRYFTKWQSIRMRDAAFTDANQNIIQNNLKNNYTSWQHIVDYTWRLNDHNALMINAAYLQTDNSQDFGLKQTQARRLPFTQQEFTAFEQIIETPAQFLSANAQILHSRNGKKIAFHTGMVKQRQSLGTTLILSDTSRKILPLTADFNNNTSFVQTNYYSGINTALRKKNTDFLADISGGYFKLDRIQELPSLNISKEQFYFLPTVGFKREWKKSTLFGTYAYNIALPQLVDVADGYVATDYRTLQRGSWLFIPANSHTAILNYTRGGFSDNFMFYTNIIGTTTDRGYRKDWRINADFNVEDNVENNFQNKSIVWAGGFEYFSAALSTRFKLRPRTVFSTFQNTLNKESLRNTSSFTNTVDFVARSALLKWFSYHLGATLTFSDVYTSVEGTKVINRNQSIGSFLDIHLNFSKLFINLENEIFYFKPSKGLPQQYAFFNASARYNLIPNKLGIILNARNLSNTRNFVNAFVNDLAVNINEARLLPRYVLLEVDFKF